MGRDTSRKLRKSTLSVRLRHDKAKRDLMSFGKQGCQQFLTSVPAKRRTPVLKDHLTRLYKHKQHYKNRLAIEGVSAHKAKVTEATGEIGATRYMLGKFPNAELFEAFSPGTGIDQIWMEKAINGKITKFYIVEAKGPNAKLSTDAAKGPQMSTMWVMASVMAMDQSNPVVQQLVNALTHPSSKVKVRGIVIEGSETTAVERPLPTSAGFPVGGFYN